MTTEPRPIVCFEASDNPSIQRLDKGRHIHLEKLDVNVSRHIADLVSRKIVDKEENMSSFLDHSKIEVPYESE
jgi:hypothetical protein